MPTFQSIPLHPMLKQRLLEPPNSDGVSITTPQALLSRTPQALADQLMLNNSSSSDANGAAILSQIDTLRSQVAHAMMAKTKTGMYRLQQQQFHDDNHHTNNNKQYRATRPLILSSTVSASQALQQEQQQRGQIHSISTGCRALDQLMSLPPEYCSVINHQTTGHTASSGFPRGHVLSITGPSGSGKSQLCLQLAVQASNSTLLNNQQDPCLLRYFYSSAGHAGSALAERYAELVENQPQSLSHRKQAMKNVEFQAIQNTTQLVLALTALEDELLHSSSERFHQSPFMIIVDSLSSIELVQDENQLGRISRMLKRLARQYSLWVVVVMNQSNSLMSGPDFHIALLNHDSGNNAKVLATLLGHSCRPDQPSVQLLHTPSGMTTKSTPEVSVAL